MAALVSSVMPYMTVTKAGKEVQVKMGLLLCFSYQGRESQEPFSRILLKHNWPELDHMFAAS